MPPCPRKEIVDPYEVGVYHCYSRCVRRAYLCGRDSRTGQSFDHRKDWLEQDTARLASIFAIDVLDICVLDNHLHHVLRNRPDIAGEWSDEEVARRWWKLHPKRRDPDGTPSDMTSAELAMQLSDPERLRERRQRLSDLSWFMKELKEPVAKRANAEESVTGHFWAERFKSTRLLDEAAVLVCSIYVDLNVIRAGQAATPEDSRYTSAWHRIQSVLAANETPWSQEEDDADQRPEQSAGDNEAESLQGVNSSRGATDVSDSARADAWLAPIPEAGEEGNQTCPASRSSDQGFLPLTVEQYLELLDWTGRQIRDSASSIPDHLAPILERLGIVADQWEATIQGLDGWFPRAIGRASAISEAAAAAGRRWFRGVGRCRAAFVE